MNITVTLTNSFHNTTASIILKPYDGPPVFGHGRMMISHAQVVRARKALCGKTDCQCGGIFGERGGTYLSVVNKDYERRVIIDLPTSHLVA